ncbi:MAG: ATP-dependent zinc metalloprotease FtsH [Candidatus Poribacteria bacterium]
MQKRAHFSIWYFVVAIGILMVIQYLFLASQIQQIPYSEFKKLVKEGKIKECTVGPTKVKGIFVDEKNKEIVFATTKVDDPSLVVELEAQNIKFTGSTESSWLRNILSWVLPIIIIVALWGFVFNKMGPGANMLSLGALGRGRAKIHADEENRVTFDDVAGVDEAKEELKEVIEFLHAPGRFKNLGAKIPKGVLLVGPPGTGKTLLAKAVAGEANVPFFSMSGSEFVEMFVGLGAARVRDLFKQAKENAPCIIFIDELDALGKARGFNPMGGHDEREQTLNQLLVEMDGFEPNIGVIIMAATNRPEILDVALMRPGRFDRQILVDKPDINGREAILKVHTKHIKLAKDVELRTVAAGTPGFAGADLANIANEAALLAARRGKEEVDMKDFDEAIERVIAGLEKKNRVMNQKEKEMIAYHESGHALAAESLPNADQVHKISIVARGISALGYTIQLPTEDRYLMTKSELLDKLKALLGGRAAEEIVFGESTTGAQNDLQRATAIAKSMVKEYGMSDELGLVTFEPERKPYFMDVPSTMPKDYSEEMASKIDSEIEKIVHNSYEEVKQILIQKRDALDKIAQRLLQKEALESDELRKIIAE